MKEGFTLSLEGGEGFRFTVDFDMPDVEPLTLDEPPPVGEGTGPNPSRMLAASVGGCLSASLLFCLRKARIEPSACRTTVEAELVRNEDGRLRIGALKVELHPDVTAADRERMDRCLQLFEDFCIVTQSVRNGIEVDARVVPNVVTESAGEA
ncbi:MAG: OsmC family protein [Gemmatimonadota bacterium]|jgi:organic hydroperoxide reductase OsmC/OhrA